MKEKKEKVTHSESVNKYAKKAYDRVQVLLRKGEKERWSNEARSRGFVSDKGQVSVSRFVRWCVEDKIGKPQIDNTQTDCSEVRNDIE